MSQENVDVVQAWTDAYNAGDVDAMMELCAQDVEAFPDRSFPEASPLYGREQFRRWMEEIRTPWVATRWVVHEARAIEPNRVLERGNYGGVGTGSSIETLASYSVIYTLRDGQISRVQFFSDHAEAIKAVRLEE
jgi:ketosteroid isomerase-like protein